MLCRRRGGVKLTQSPMQVRTIDAFAELERQLAEERVSALGRIGAKLGALLRSLDDLMTRLGRLTGPERAEALAAYRTLHAEARRHRWHLEVQRDAMGICGHDVLDRVYPLLPAQRAA